MTVASTDKRTQYTGSGSVGPFTIGFPILASSHIKVTRTVIATNVSTVLTLNAGSDGYTVNTDLDAVTLTEALASSTERLTIERNVPLTQLTDYVANSAFPADVNERALDQLTMITQQLQDGVDRSVKVASTTLASVVPTITDAPADGRGLVWDGVTGNLRNTTFVLSEFEDAITGAEAAAITATTQAGLSSGFADDASDSADAAAASAASVDFTLSTNNTFTGTNIFQNTVDLTNVNAETSAGWDLRTSAGASCLSGGAGGAANLTAGGNLSMNTTHKIVNMADPTSAQDAATKAYVDAEVAAIPSPSVGARVLLETITASSDSTVEFTSNIDDTYQRYEIEITNLKGGSQGVNLSARTSSNNGSSYDSGGSDYKYGFMEVTSSSGSIAIINGTSSSFTILAGLGVSAGEAAHSNVILFDPTNVNTDGNIMFDSMHIYDNLGGSRRSSGGAKRDAVAAFNAIQFFMSSGNIVSGTFKLYGVI